MRVALTEEGGGSGVFGQDPMRAAVHRLPAVGRRSWSLEGVTGSLIGGFSRREARSRVWSSGNILWLGRLDGEEKRGDLVGAVD
jgi:hypothetical protein